LKEIHKTWSLERRSGWQRTYFKTITRDQLGLEIHFFFFNYVLILTGELDAFPSAKRNIDPGQFTIGRVN